MLQLLPPEEVQQFLVLVVSLPKRWPVFG